MKELEGKTIVRVIEGILDGWDEAVIYQTSDDKLYLLESGSGDSRGVLCMTEILKIPKEFKEEEI